MRNLGRPLLVLVGLCLGPADLAASQAGDASEDEPLVFRHALDDSILDVLTPRPEETFTPQVETFHITGENPYSGDDEAIADGRALYNRWCQACHMPDGSGRIGPALNDDAFLRPRVATDQGMFEIIYGGGAGAMQAFGVRMDQDDILRVMAFLKTLREQ